MKKLLILCLLLNTATFAQKKQNIYFLKNDGREVRLKDSADFIRIIQEPDSGSVHYNLYEFYPNDQKKLVGHVSKFEPRLVYEGQFVSFYPNGKKETNCTYENGKRTGLAFLYYENGRVKEMRDYPSGQKSEGFPGGEMKAEKYKVITHLDSAGKETVKDGNGYARYYDSKKEMSEEGEYSNGVKNGRWKGQIGKNFYEETYLEGTFIGGLATLADGSQVKYNDPEQLPAYANGMQEFYRYVAMNYVYPAQARIHGVRGKLILSFVVEKDGTLTDIKAVQDLGWGTGEEALRILRNSQKWVPGKQHGIPVRVAFTLPIMLNLS